MSPTSTSGLPDPAAHGRVRELADDLHRLLLAADPFGASEMGVPGYDALVPDVSAGAEAERRSRLEALITGAPGIAGDRLGPADAVTLECVRATAAGAAAAISGAGITYTVSATFGDGPAPLLGLAARTRARDEAAGADWLARVSATPAYLDDCLTRLREGAAAGRHAVAPLVDTALAQLEELLAGDLDEFSEPLPDPGADPGTGADPGMGAGRGADPDRGAGWVPDLRDRLAAVVQGELRPALQRYRDALRDEVAPAARPGDRAGLWALDGGPEAYLLAVREHTTLDLTPDRVHAAGLADLETDHERMLEIGGPLFGVRDLAGVLDGIRRAGADPDVAAAMDRARAAVRRAEAAAPDWLPDPPAPPCAVRAMSPLLARAGMAPHYTPPSPDGSREGTYWFNADRPGLGTGAELESVTYHEAVPGHHSQLVRMLGLTGVPDLQRERTVTAHAEGWGLYAEVLAEEMGLYPDALAVLGMLATDAFRAARLVVDSGLHALGWTRDRAVSWFVEQVPLPAGPLAAEVDRYLAWPGQALAYKTGQREILRLRAAATARLGDRFDIRGFHGAVLDSGSVPLPALGTAVDAWVADRLNG